MRLLGISFFHVFLPLAYVGDMYWRITPTNVMAQTSSSLPRWELKYFSYYDVTGFRSPITSFLAGIVLRSPTMGERVFVFTKKRRGKKVTK